MSFSSEQKEYIITQNYRSTCCRRALLQGSLSARSNAAETAVTLSIERTEYAAALQKLIREFYGKESQILRHESGGRCILLRFESKSAANYIANFENRRDLFTEKCPLCASAFLRGVFLSSGRISDPQKQYSLEFSFGDRTDIFADYFASLGLLPKVSDKKNGKVLYFKNSSEIEDFLGRANMNPAMFAVIEARFNGEAKKNIMRALNCETKNMQKTVNAAVEQNELIEELVKANLFSSLPEELEAVARLRMHYPDYSLAQLAAVATPSISKSGLSHRMKKLMELGKQLLHKT